MSKGLVSSLIAALAFFLIFVLTYPSYNSMQSARETLSKTEQKLKVMQRAQAKFTQLSVEYETKKGEVDRMGIFLPDNERADYLITSIEEISNQAGLRLDSIAITTERDNSINFSSVKIAVEHVGSYQGFITFLNSLESSLRLYDISNISIAPGDGINSMAISLTINAYFLNSN